MLTSPIANTEDMDILTINFCRLIKQTQLFAFW